MAVSNSQKIIVRLPPLPTIKEILRLYNVHALKALGQNFLLDPKLTSKFVSKAGKIRDTYVCEVGPGPGSITRSILNQQPIHVIAVEKDPRFIPAMSLLQEACKGKLSVVIGDILNFKMGKLFPSECLRSWDDDVPPIHLMGNLPFNVSLPLLIQWLHAISERRDAWRYGRARMTLTVQEEVAVRMTAPAGHSERCRLSVMCQNWCDVEHHFTIPGRAFLPKPEVNVGVVTLTPRIEPQVKAEFKLFEKVVRNVFNMRRKHCKHPIGRLFPVARREELTQKMLTVADVEPTVAPYELTMDEFSRLINTFILMLEQYPHFKNYDSRYNKFDDDSIKWNQ